MVETSGQCHAEIWLQNSHTEERYCWDFCNQQPGHDGPHEVWSDRDQATWATWDSGVPSSPFVDLTGAETRPSPGTPDEITILRSVKTDTTADMAEPKINARKVSYYMPVNVDADGTPLDSRGDRMIETSPGIWEERIVVDILNFLTRTEIAGD
jgi:hypothetical protein